MHIIRQTDRLQMMLSIVLKKAIRVQLAIGWRCSPLYRFSSVGESNAQSTKIDKSKVPAVLTKVECGSENAVDDLEELEEMFIEGPAGMEWGGPTRSQLFCSYFCSRTKYSFVL